MIGRCMYCGMETYLQYHKMNIGKDFAAQHINDYESTFNKVQIWRDFYTNKYAFACKQCHKMMNEYDINDTETRF